MKADPRISYIDTWRFLAILLVLCSHIIEYSHPIYETAVPGLFWRARGLGTLGVQVFFCISGYVICRGMIRESQLHGAVNMRGFYVRRAFRILPPLAIYCVFILLLTAAGVASVTGAQVAQSVAFLCNFSSVGQCGWLLGHTWSLAYEEQFYLVFPLVFSVLALGRHRARLPIIVLVLAAAAIALHLLDRPALATYLSTFTFMAWGCVFAFYEKELRPLLERLPVAAWAAVALLVLAAYTAAKSYGVATMVYPTVAPLAICIAVFGTPMRNRIVGAAFGNQRLAYLGKISYTVYLWQQASTGNLGLASPLPTFLLIVLVFVVAHLSYRHIERPLIAIGAALSARWTRPAATAAGPVVSVPDDPEAPRIHLS
ncbi:acyltransferase family protein [Massilia sp. TN1-12]|uniref:acyltransferase family protein n=1 Tax=Massilia paldalensis TaxID=3377675 RepID=UPI00384BA36E